jgi:hypothetical protein
MSVALSSWWTLLCAVSALNVFAWALSAAVLQRRQPVLGDEVYRTRRLQLLLSAGYVAGCAFRSAFPVFDVPRQVIVDSWLSSVLVGRSVATVAELCFVTQWALLLRELSSGAALRFGRRTAAAIVPMIVVAELCSWHAVLTASNLGHVIEESLWGLSAALVVASLVALWPRCRPALRPLLAACAALGVAYVGYMFCVDVPMYWSRRLADEAQGRAHLSLGQGLLDVAGRWTVSHRWEDWQSEATWMALYFSVAVWMSIALVHWPALRFARAAESQVRLRPDGRAVAP